MRGQPHDQQPFREVRVHAWEHSAMYSREQAAKSGVTISEIEFDDSLHAYPGCKLRKRRSQRAPWNRVEGKIAE